METHVKISEITTTGELREFMTTPTNKLVELMSELEGDIMVLGGAGKVGPELVETIVRANREAGARRTVHVADLFPDGGALPPERIKKLGAKVIRGDLTNRAFIQSLPDVPNVIYMVGLKFGSSGDWRRAFHLNGILPYLVGERFGTSSIVVFCSSNPYPHTRPAQRGSKETDQLEPQGVYGWGIVARESAFATTQLDSPAQKLCFYRLAYAQHLGYGVLVDLARMVQSGEPISLAVPAVNLISQRDAIDVAIRALGLCDNPPLVLNVAGPIVAVRNIVERIGKLMGRKPKLADEEGEACVLVDDSHCVELLGPYRDGVDEMIEAAAKWVASGGEYWDKPTLFGRLQHVY